MLKVASSIENLYYFGEFGYFNVDILGGLNHYFRQHPKKLVHVATYQDYGEILRILFPKNVVDYETRSGGTHRSGHKCSLDREFTEKRWKNLDSLSHDSKVKKLSLNHFESPINMYIHHLDRPITCKEPPDSYQGKSVICINPRFRKHFSQKNLSQNDWRHVFKLVLHNHPDRQIVGLGKASEMMSLTDRPITTANTIQEHIFYLNVCDYGVFPDSGMAEFALNCNCDVVVVWKGQFYQIYDHVGRLKKLLFGFNPFNRRITKIDAHKLKSAWITHNRKMSS